MQRRTSGDLEADGADLTVRGAGCAKPHACAPVNTAHIEVPFLLQGGEDTVFDGANPSDGVDRVSCEFHHGVAHELAWAMPCH